MPARPAGEPVVASSGGERVLADSKRDALYALLADLPSLAGLGSALRSGSSAPTPFSGEPLTTASPDAMHKSDPTTA